MEQKLTVNRGVEAKEMDYSLGSHLNAADGDHLTPSDQSASYVQVVVHKRQRPVPATRLPAASSPRGRGYPPPPPPAEPVMAGCAVCGGGGRWPQETEKLAGARQEKVDKSKSLFWNKEVCCEECCGPDRIEMYHFEKYSDFLCTYDGVGETSVERAARALGGPPARALHELLAALRLLLQLPVSVFLHIERCAMSLVCGAMTGALRIASDQLLKPALTLVFNSLLRPLLVCAGQTAGVAREAVRPLWLSFGDALEPFTRLVAQIRLVQYERGCSCTQYV